MKLEIINGIMDHILVDGIWTCQRPETPEALIKLKQYLLHNNIIISDIVEIGTHHGGFTSMLAYVFNDINIHSFEHNNYINEHTRLMENHKNIKVYVEDIVHTNTADNIIKNTKNNCLVFCDGGLPGKDYEFERYSKILKKNDFIFCHDYIKDSETFNNEYNNKIWNWHQVSYESIKKSVEDNNLKNILPEVFEPVVWSSYIKQHILNNK
jgi:predicted O-methyltransferase YrrM